MVNRVDVGCYIFLDHSKCSILTAKYNPDNHFCLYLDFFTVWNDMFNDDCATYWNDMFNDDCATYYTRFHCGWYHNGTMLSQRFLQQNFMQDFGSIAINGIQSKLRELGFSLDILTNGIAWDDPKMLIRTKPESNFYLKMECDKRFLVECDPYYRWAING